MLHETGGAVVLCSLTTTLGYFALTFSANRAIVSFGIAAAAGEISLHPRGGARAAGAAGVAGETDGSSVGALANRPLFFFFFFFFFFKKKKKKKKKPRAGDPGRLSAPDRPRRPAIRRAAGGWEQRLGRA